jgi:hypothetical protein
LQRDLAPAGRILKIGFGLIPSRTEGIKRNPPKGGEEINRGYCE